MVAASREAGPLAAVVGALLATAASGALAAEATTERVSVSSAERQANGASYRPSVSGDGRLVAFETDALNLGQGPYVTRVVVRDRAAGTTRRVDLDPAGEPVENGGLLAEISRDGRFVAFVSNSDELVPGDTNGKYDVFVRNLAAGTTVRASLKNSGREIRGNDSFLDAISGDGRFVVFGSQARTVAPDGQRAVLVRDLRQGRTTPVSASSSGALADADSRADSISGDGRFVGFWSFAGNLVANDANGQADSFVRDRKTGMTTIVSVATGGAPGNGESFGSYVSDDGNIVAFQSSSTNLVPGDTNGRVDVFVRDVRAGKTERISLAAGGGQADADSFPTGISADGRHVLLYSEATNLVQGDTNGAPDVFVHDRVTGRTSRASVSASGAQANANTGLAALSADGGTVAFESSATNLVPGDTNGDQDVFARTLGSIAAP